MDNRRCPTCGTAASRSKGGGDGRSIPSGLGTDTRHQLLRSRSCSCGEPVHGPSIAKLTVDVATDLPHSHRV